jgi:hypothetical protein
VNYHPDDFLSLVEEVEHQGGVHLSDEHKPTTVRLNYPIDAQNPTGPKAARKFFTTGCHRRAQFLVPLLPEAYFMDDEEIQTSPDYDFDDSLHPTVVMSDGETPALAKVCAVDDSMGLWPRFIGAMHTGESFEPFE